MTETTETTETTATSAAEASAAEANALCTQCGLCCDGTFFGSVIVERAETERLERVGLRVLLHDGGTTMPQPCSALRGCVCAVYTDRPSACARYECSLRKQVSEGARDLADATAKVERMRALLATARRAFDCPAGGSIWETILALQEPKTPEEASAAARTYAEGIAAVGELLELGRASFEPRFAGGGVR